MATLTAVQPPGRFGALVLDGTRVTSFQEKPKGDGGWINGGFFVCSPAVLDLIAGDETVWEREPLETLARERSLAAYFQRGFTNSGSWGNLSCIVRRQTGTGERENGQIVRCNAAWGG